MKKLAIDFTWLRHGKVGGTESSITNLLNGLRQLQSEEAEIYLVTAIDNHDFIRNKFGADYFKYLKANTICSSQRKRVLWQNFGLCKLLKENGITRCLEPIYNMPFTPLKGIKFYTIIHDLQAIHYPQYFSKARICWMDLSWRNSVRRSEKVIAISDYVRDDILQRYNPKEGKIIRIYDAIEISTEKCAEKSELDKYNVKEKEYYYTVSSLLPHKNLKTLLYTISKIKKQQPDMLFPLVVSGVGGTQETELKEITKEENIEDYVILTGFVSDEVRNMLYKNCKAFLFPSIFEGFGMPPIEAMAFGVPVITTTESCIEEITGGLADYVTNPTDVDEWIRKISACHTPDKQAVDELLENYRAEKIARELLSII
ncbi:glycosyltransferase family 4 protein [Butyrivibrio sp. AD3002]|uniref:glycosyltransferase family 4 protein n=1 Tax=Butyrivibrio sp. AD3002 TaxID=1280670 RepID=UPI0003B42EEF|nr:glycosyltransferase family 1 protein [Butyrivibrio sp. AD3002]